MAEFPALPIFTDAYLADTRHLTAAQHGAYLLLLMMAWRTPDCSLPDDDEKLARWSCMDKRTWKANKDTILSFWTRNNSGQLIQKRLLDERKYVEQLRNKNVRAGKISYLKRLNRGSTTVQPEVNKTSTPTPTPTPIEKEKYTKEKPDEEITYAQADKPSCTVDHQPDAGANTVTPTAKHDKSDPAGFELFWKNFPIQRKGSRERALRAYSLALKRASAEKINLSVLQYSKSQEVKTGYAKGAAAWLNDDRFETDYSVNPKNAKMTETNRSQSREVF